MQIAVDCLCSGGQGFSTVPVHYTEKERKERGTAERHRAKKTRRKEAAQGTYSVLLIE